MAGSLAVQRLISTWVDSEELNEKNLDQTLHSVDGILVPEDSETVVRKE